MSKRDAQKPPQRGQMGVMLTKEKPKDFKGNLKRLVKYLMPQKHKFIAVFILAIGSTVFGIVGPRIMGLATTKLAEGVTAKAQYFMDYQSALSGGLPPAVADEIMSRPMPSFDMNYIANVLLFLLAIYAFSSILSYITGFIMSDVAQRTVFNMRTDVKAKLDRMPLKYFDSMTHGEILSRVTNDMDNIANTLQQSLTQVITSVVTIIGILVMMISISPIMTLIALVVLPLSLFITMFIVKKSQKYFAKQQAEIGILNGHVEEMLSGHKVVKVFGHEQASVEKFDEINQQYYKAGWKAQFISGLIQPALGFIGNLGYVFVCIVGGIFVANKVITVGDIQAFIQYMRSFTMPIVQTANIANIIQSTIASAERVFQVLDEQEETPDNKNPMINKDVTGDVIFEHVKFGYKPEEILMEDINISIKSGDTVAIVGPTGAGKTTLINLLMRFYDLDDGKILVDGVDIAQMPRGDLRKSFGMVLQDTWLFNGTILDNIRYGRQDATKEEAVAAAKAARADHFIRGLPDGYNTLLDEEASNISQGQKQLLTIARALMTDPSILILDEATSNVDTRTEILVQKAMDKLMDGRTSFVIAHRLSTIKNADLILVMNKGNIIEHGTQEQLMATKGFYADLYNSQFSDED